MTAPIIRPRTTSMSTEPAGQHYIVNVSYCEVVEGSPNPKNKVDMIVAKTVDEAFAKFRTSHPDSEVTQIMRGGQVQV